MKTKLLITLTASTVLGATIAAAGWRDREGRRWDQDRAVAAVENVLAIESEGQPWDKIPWLTDPDEAALQAAAQDRPIFLYFYLEKQVGPAAAPG